LGNIAVDLERALTRRARLGEPGRTAGRVLARGEGWVVEDVICTSGPGDRPFEEQHHSFSVAVVLTGTFQYRAAAGREVMTPGSVLLGSPGQAFECGHQHGSGDRCVAFRFSPDRFELLLEETGVAAPRSRFGALRIPPTRSLAPVVARVGAGLSRGNLDWEAVAIELAVAAIGGGWEAGAHRSEVPNVAEARVTQAVRRIDSDPASQLSLAELAREAGLSRWHFLRAFGRVTGLTPHQYLKRARLRDAAIRLAIEPAKVIEIAYRSGFGDLSTFNRAFRVEFGASPRAYRGPRVGASSGGRR